MIRDPSVGIRTNGKASHVTEFVNNSAVVFELRDIDSYKVHGFVLDYALPANAVGIFLCAKRNRPAIAAKRAGRAPPGTRATARAVCP